MKRSVTGLITAVVTFVATTPLVAIAATNTVYYLEGDGVPSASMTTSSLPGGALPDYDDSGDPGRFLKHSDVGSLDTNPDKFQQWSVSAGGLTILGVSTLTIWYAYKDFKDDKTGNFTAYLMDCKLIVCSVITSTTKSTPEGGTWAETTLNFPAVTHTFDSGHSMRVMVVVNHATKEDMMFAYGRSSYPSKLNVNKTVPTTTTSTSTTSTTAPTTTTTTTAGSPTTTTAGSPTTTTPGSPTTTTPGSSTTTPAGETSTPAGETSTTVAGSTTTTGALSDDPETVGGPLIPTTSTTLPPSEQVLDREKSNLVVRTTPGQRGIQVASGTLELAPLEGLMVSFLNAAETLKTQLWQSVTLGVIAAALLMIGMTRRFEDEDGARSSSIET